jgi:hypothetical protein
MLVLLLLLPALDSLDGDGAAPSAIDCIGCLGASPSAIDCGCPGGDRSKKLNDNSFDPY